VGVAVGHYENAWVTFSKQASLAGISALLSDQAKAPFVTFLPGASGDGLSSLASIKDRDRALVGRLRPDARDKTGRTVCLTVVATICASARQPTPCASPVAGSSRAIPSCRRSWPMRAGGLFACSLGLLSSCARAVPRPTTRRRRAPR